MKYLGSTLAIFLMASSCLAADMPQTARDLNCTNCHEIDQKIYGPPWREVSKRYREVRDDPATLNALIKKVSTGGSGNWGSLPMVANDPLGKRRDKIEELVKFILALSDQR